MLSFFNQVATTQFNELILNHQSKIDEEINGQEEPEFSWRKSITESQVYKPVTILFFLLLLQQLSGGYVLIFYTINIFRNLGSGFAASINENLASLFLGLIRLVMAIVAAVTSQKCNRKTLLYISTLGMSIFALAASIKTWSSDGGGHSIFLKHGVSKSAISSDEDMLGNYFLLIYILLYIFFASIGLLIIPWTCIAELFPTKYKAKYGGLTVALAYVQMSVVLRIFPFLLDSVSISVIFLIFSFASFACGIFVRFYLPETHRRTFNEIEKYFLRKA